MSKKTLESIAPIQMADMNQAGKVRQAISTLVLTYFEGVQII